MELIENARRNSERLTHLINDLLDVEKIESGSMTFNLRSVDLGALIEQSVEANRAYAARFGVVYRFTGERREVHVEADEERLMQVMANLLSNAAKFSPAGGEVEVGMTVNDGYVLVSVTDHGPGIPDDFRERIFERFSQADASDTRLHGGTGLGLSISKAIIERLHGRIGFDTRPGDGTTFWFELPRRLD
jgi:signal transduction histidine kinase